MKTLLLAAAILACGATASIACPMSDTVTASMPTTVAEGGMTPIPTTTVETKTGG